MKKKEKFIMTLLIISIIVSIIAFIVLGFKFDNESDILWKPNLKQVFAIFGFVICLFGTFTKIPANSVGILYSPFNGTSENTLNEGFHSKNIFDSVYVITTEVQTMNVGNITTQTKDAQYITTTLDIKYRVNQSNAYVVFKQYRTLDNMSSALIAPTTQRILELITTEYNVMDILGEKRGEIYSKLEADLSKEFDMYGVEFYSISIVDMDAGDAIEKAIEDEAVAKKQVETAKQNLEKTKTEAQAQSVKAQAEQDAAKIEAETKLIEAEAEKKANEMLNESLTDEVLRKEWIAKWDGRTPTYYAGSDGNTSLIFDAE